MGDPVYDVSCIGKFVMFQGAGRLEKKKSQQIDLGLRDLDAIIMGLWIGVRFPDAPRLPEIMYQRQMRWDLQDLGAIYMDANAAWKRACVQAAARCQRMRWGGQDGDVRCTVLLIHVA